MLQYFRSARLALGLQYFRLGLWGLGPRPGRCFRSDRSVLVLQLVPCFRSGQSAPELRLDLSIQSVPLVPVLRCFQLDQLALVLRCFRSGRSVPVLPCFQSGQSVLVRRSSRLDQSVPAIQQALCFQLVLSALVLQCRRSGRWDRLHLGLPLVPSFPSFPSGLELPLVRSAP